MSWGLRLQLATEKCHAGGTIVYYTPDWKWLQLEVHWIIHQISGESHQILKLGPTLTDQLYLRILASGYPHGAHRFFWIWKATFPHLLQRVWVLLRLLPNELVPLVWKRNMFWMSLISRLSFLKIILFFIDDIQNEFDFWMGCITYYILYHYDTRYTFM